MLAPAALLLAATAAGPNDWVEFPATTRWADNLFFAQVERAKDQGGRIALPVLYVSRGSYTELTVTIDCAARTVAIPAGPSRLRHNNQPNGSVVAMTYAFEKAGGPRAPAEWLCGGRPAAGLAGRNRFARDPKANAWARIDAFMDTLPGLMNTTLANAAPHLTFTLDGTTTPVASARSDACKFYLVLTNGRKATLDLMANSIHPRTRSIGFDRITIKGFTPEEYEAIEYTLQWTPAC